MDAWDGPHLGKEERSGTTGVEVEYAIGKLVLDEIDGGPRFLLIRVFP